MNNWKNLLFKTLLFSPAFLLFFSFSGPSQNEFNDIPNKREVRGAWIATVANIDWPSKKGLNSIQQKEEYIRILENHKNIGINTLFVQVRAASDAFYGTGQEPWSEWLTGTQGKAPRPYYDPLYFMIELAHEKNMEFHAWLNLNRGTHNTSTAVASNHITKTHPQWFINYGGTKVYDFGIPEVRNYIIGIVRDLVQNYDIDGIHFDDYFYPYPIAGQKINDAETYRKYGGDFTNIADWRRNNVNLLIQGISKVIKEEKPYVKFGISPFGVWRSRDKDLNGSDTPGALNSYDDLYADSKLWAEKGWIDYLVPQVYWSFNDRRTPYQKVSEWWVKNKKHHHLYIGMAAYRTGNSNGSWKDASEISKQINFNKNHPEIDGSVFFSSKSLMPNGNGLSETVKNAYKYPALPPLMPWLEASPLPKPDITDRIRSKDGRNVRIKWEIPEEYEEYVMSFVVYRFQKGDKKTLNDPKNIVGIVRNSEIKSFVDSGLKPGSDYEYAVTALDRLSNESQPSKLYKL